jgi:hypothetical protein
MIENPSAVGTSHFLAPQVVEKRLTVNQPQRSVSERRRLAPQAAVVGDLVHEVRVLIFPSLPGGRVLRQTISHLVLSIVVAAQRTLDPIRGFAHEP